MHIAQRVNEDQVFCALSVMQASTKVKIFGAGCIAKNAPRVITQRVKNLQRAKVALRVITQ